MLHTHVSFYDTGFALVLLWVDLTLWITNAITDSMHFMSFYLVGTRARRPLNPLRQILLSQWYCELHDPPAVVCSRDGKVTGIVVLVVLRDLYSTFAFHCGHSVTMIPLF